jgi:hypothetical protein
MTKKYLSSIRPNGIYEEPKLNNKMREEEEENEKETTLVEDKIAFLKSLYAPENTNGYNRHAYIVRDYLKYPLNSYIEHNANLNAFDDEDALILYIIDKELEKQR